MTSGRIKHCILPGCECNMSTMGDGCESAYTNSYPNRIFMAFPCPAKGRTLPRRSTNAAGTRQRVLVGIASHPPDAPRGAARVFLPLGLELSGGQFRLVHQKL